MKLPLLVVLACGFTVSAADLNRGKQLYVEGNYSAAESELRPLVSEKGDDAAAHRMLGLALIEQDKVSEGATHINKAVELDSSGDNKIALARLYIAQKDLDKAEEAVRDAQGENLEYVRGLVHLHRDRYEDAAKDFEEHLQKNPSSAYAHYYAGLAYNGLKRPDKMLSHFQQFVQMKPDAPEARKVRAVLKTGR